MNKGFSNVLLIAIIFVILGGLGAGAYYFLQKNQPKACTTEARICPDGTLVGRTGSNCEFEPCPEPKGSVCKDQCGDGICQEIVCQGSGCPCAETKENCPKDCGTEQKPAFDYNALISSELKKLDVVLVGEQRQSPDIILPLNFTGADWYLKNLACKDGGYSLAPYGGKAAKLFSYQITETFQKKPLFAWIIISQEKIACVYKAVDTSSNIASGVFPVTPKSALNDPKYCQTDADCACGVKIGTKECFYGNKQFVDTQTQCPDYCTGIDGKFRTKCVENRCSQVHEDSLCVNQCGNGTCQEVVCLGTGCPCAETKENCSADCK